MESFPACPAANKYIHDVVCARLSQQVDTSYLDSLVQCVKSYSHFTIVTLNHDCLLDDKLKAEGVTVCDGFKKPQTGLRVWEHDHILDRRESVRLVHLHGSVNWSWLNDRIVYGFHRDRHPLVMIGTTTKPADYFEFIYYDMMRAFDLSLRQSDHLLVCGYGFMDRIVNERLREWTKANEKSRISVVDNRPRKDFDAMGVIANKLVEYSGNGVDHVEWNQLVANLTKT